jgi:circadian clock protein KaiC
MKSPLNGTLQKAPTGINGLDEITEGGLPAGRPTLICGGPGCGKTLFATEFLINGATQHGEPGIFISFEESPHELIQNVKSLGFDIAKLIRQKKLHIDHIVINRDEIEETGDYDLEGLFVRINYAVEKIGAKRIVLDTIESLFSSLNNEAALRAEIRRLFHWLKEKGLTAVITGERGEKTLTRQGLEEYVSDCVILLDFRVTNQIATRRLRIVKYRGSPHGTNEYPFIINDHGISVLPITSLRLNHRASPEIVSTGLVALDQMLQKKGVFRGSSMLITGTAGTAKTILAGYFTKGSADRKERVLYFSFEESPDQLIRNLKSIGVDIKPFVQTGLVHIHSSRPTLQGLELHLMTLFTLIDKINPRLVIIDPISSLINVGSTSEVSAMLVRLIDQLKAREINAVFTALTHTRISTRFEDTTEDAVSSLADLWIRLCNENTDGQITRKLLIVKNRGMGHLNREVNFTVDRKGIHIMLPASTKNP